MPGLSLDYTNQRQTQTGGGLLTSSGTMSRNRSLSLSARLAEGTLLNLGATHLEYNVAVPGADTRQDGLQMALQSALTSSTDLSLNLGRNKASIGGAQNYQSIYAGIWVRDRTSSNLSLGIGYRRSNTRSGSGPAGSFHIISDIVDLDVLCLPTYDVGISARLSYQANNGQNVSDLLAPSVNLRWQIAPSTNLTVNYAFERLRQWDFVAAAIADSDTTGLSLRLTHSLSNGSSIDLAYDSHAATLGELEWRRQLRLYYTTHL